MAVTEEPFRSYRPSGINPSSALSREPDVLMADQVPGDKFSQPSQQSLGL